MDINIPAVLAASFSSFVFGALWYSPLLFLKRWCAETGVNPNKDVSNPGKVYGLTAVFTLLSVLAFTCFLPVGSDLIVNVRMGALVGAGFVLTSMGINYQFSQRSVTLWLIDGGFHVFRFSIVGAVLSFFYS